MKQTRKYATNRNEAPNLKSVCLALNLDDANIRNGYKGLFNRKSPTPETRQKIAEEYMKQAQQYAETLKQ